MCHFQLASFPGVRGHLLGSQEIKVIGYEGENSARAFASSIRQKMTHESLGKEIFHPSASSPPSQQTLVPKAVGNDFNTFAGGAQSVSLPWDQQGTELPKCISWCPILNGQLNVECQNRQDRDTAKVYSSMESPLPCWNSISKSAFHFLMLAQTERRGTWQAHLYYYPEFVWLIFCIHIMKIKFQCFFFPKDYHLKVKPNTSHSGGSGCECYLVI